MSTNIDNSANSVLNTYAVLASSGITTVNTTTIMNGFYGTPGGIGIVGAFVGTLDGANATLAQTQLTDLVNAINAVAITESINGGSGTIVYTPGRYDASSTIIYDSGTNIIIDAQTDINAQFFFTAVSTIMFNSIASIVLINGASTCNIFWLAGTGISFTGTSPFDIHGIFIAGSAITFDNDSTILGRLYAQTENITFSGTSYVNATCEPNVVCYVKGTLILTENGYVPIEKIEVGDKVVVQGKIVNFSYVDKDEVLHLEPVIWVGNFKVLELNDESRPICIEKDALDPNYPFQDLYISPDHSLLLDGKIVVASSLINGTKIYQDKTSEIVEYYHFECNDHFAIFANGVLSESYFDANNRSIFL